MQIDPSQVKQLEITLNIVKLTEQCQRHKFMKWYYRSSHKKKGVLRNFAKFIGKQLCQSLFFQSLNFIKKETLAQVFSSEFCEISKDIFSYRIPLVAASGIKNAKTIYVYIGSHRK